MKKLCTLSLAVLMGAACGEMPEVAPFGGVEQPIVNGTPGPQNTFLTPGQQLAVLFLTDSSGSPFCSGTLVAPRVVITAKHCTHGSPTNSDASKVRVGFGTRPASPLAIIPVAEIHENPTNDFNFLILGGDATAVVDGVVPIAMNRDPVGASWFGRWVDASGWGDTYDTNPAGKYFASVEVIGTDAAESTVLVDGHGEQGICYGDSGGPIIYQPDVGTPPVVVGAEFWGDNSCVDVDHLTRVDLNAALVDARVSQGLPPPLTPCPGQSGTGGCENGTAVWCKADFLFSEDCTAQGLSCGYLGASTGYGCLPASCGNVDFYGACSGETLSWCGPSGLSTRNCAASSLSCMVDGTSNVAVCRACTCDFANATGHCTGGACIIDACTTGFVDKDGDGSNGCEAKQEQDQGCAATPHSFAALVAAALLLVLEGRRRRSRRGLS